MKRISFKDSGGLNLTQAVLSGRKTMTRRIAYKGEIKNINTGFFSEGKNRGRFALCESNFVVAKSQYGIDEIVAIQQAYKDVADYAEMIDATRDTAGWTNKMFVAASMMPHHIRITDIRVERLVDISYSDCLREGILPIWDSETEPRKIDCYDFTGSDYVYKTARTAFSHLIDKVSGRGTWDSNPLVWVYSFELVD
jgi:hypothetical protein